MTEEKKPVKETGRLKAHRVLGVISNWARVYDKEGTLLHPQFELQPETCSEFHIVHALEYLLKHTSVNIEAVYTIECPWRGEVVTLGWDRVSKIVPLVLTSIDVDSMSL